MVFFIIPFVYSEEQKSAGYAIQAVPFTSVHVQDGFWTPRLETNSRVTIPYCFKKCEDTGRINNFAKAAGKMRLEGKEYVVQDGDIMLFRFNA